MRAKASRFFEHRRWPGPSSVVAVLWLAAGCSGPSPDAANSVDGSTDTAPPADGAPADGPPGTEDAPRIPCAQNRDCPSDHFCGRASKTCVSTVARVVAGTHHSCALHKDGTVTCWGLGKSIDSGAPEVTGPVEIGGLRLPLTLAAGTDTTCAITSDGRGRCWGAKDFVITGEDGAALGELSNVAVGSTFGCATNPEGTFCWGTNEFGQLARPLEFRESAGAVLSDPGPRRFLAAGFAVVTHDGADRICAWGSNLAKVVADSNDVSLYTSPQCGTLTDVAELAVGSQHACIRHAGGTFACWGERYYGQLGLGGDDTADIPPYGADTSLSAGVADIVAGVSHTCALLVDGNVICFGLNSLGQVGPGANTTDQEVRTPAAVSGFSGKVVGLGAGSSAQHTCAIVDDGSVECWGSDDSGQLGDGVTTVDAARFSHGPVAVQW
jgi:alpha-tubulin suppressor-like RCC1 family protein